MITGFYNLFRRSKFFRAAECVEPISDQRSSERSQRERFVASVIAFCWVRDQVFRDAFWKSILGGVGNSPTNLEMDVEKFHWADLLLKDDKRLFIVECKINAGLDSKQKPGTPEWNNPRGYGIRIRKYAADWQLEPVYILLEREKTLNIPSQDGNIKISQRTWDELAVALPLQTHTNSPPSLSDDFISLMSDFNVRPFVMKNFEKDTTKVTAAADVTGAIKIVSVLKKVETFMEKLKPKPKPIFSDEMGVQHGVWISHAPQNLGVGSFELISIGYAESANGPCIVGWWQTQDESQYNKLRDDLQSKLLQIAKVLPEGGDLNGALILPHADKPRSSDICWFTEVLQTIGILHQRDQTTVIENQV